MSRRSPPPRRRSPFLTVRAEVLIRAVWTVLFAIAGVSDVDAAAVVTLELVAGAAPRAHCGQTHKHAVGKRQAPDGPHGQTASVTFRLALRRQHGDRDVIGALLARRVRHGQLEGVHPLLETTELQQPWMRGLSHEQKWNRVLYNGRCIHHDGTNLHVDGRVPPDQGPFVAVDPAVVQAVPAVQDGPVCGQLDHHILSGITARRLVRICTISQETTVTLADLSVLPNDECCCCTAADRNIGGNSSYLGLFGPLKVR